jgi:hypothetical protein
MIRATRYGSGSTRLKPSSCDSTAGSPSMTADPWYRCVQELTFKESRALSQTATLKIHSTELALSTPLWIVENLTRRLHKRSCKQARFKHKIDYPAITDLSPDQGPCRFDTKCRHRRLLARASRLVMLRLRLKPFDQKLCSLVLPCINSSRLYSST